MRFRRVPELLHQRMRLERGLHDPALHAPSPAVDQAHLTEPGPVRGLEVVADHRLHVARMEGVKVDEVFDGEGDRVVQVLTPRRAVPNLRSPRRTSGTYAFSYFAVTLVLMPPLGVKSPTTTIRLGPQAATRSSRIWLVALS